MADDRTDAVGRQKLLEFELSCNAYYEIQRQYGCCGALTDERAVLELFQRRPQR